MKKIIECVPNFSEGNDLGIIKQITSQIEAIEGVKLLDVDPGASTNRTVVTFVGEPEAVIEAAFQAIRKAAELIDMRKHKGAHPRMGATDVCPLIPVSGVSDEEAILLSKKLAERVGKELGIPIFLYEKAASAPHRQNLAEIRSGEYEGFFEKIKQKEWAPDFGPSEFNSKSGGTVIGVREFLIAYNVNLNSTSVRKANSVAFDIREAGRVKTDNGKPWGKPVIGSDGEPEKIPGTFKGVKAIGWFVKEYGIAQVSINITNTKQAPLHEVFEECVKRAAERGMRVTGSEIVGLLPKKSLVDAGRFYLSKQERSLGVSESELIHIAIKSLGLNEVAVFDPKKKIIEYTLEENTNKLADLTLTQFANELASESPAPGGGSVASLCGALGASLGTMVANLSAGKRGWEEKLEKFSSWAQRGQEIKETLLRLVDEDTLAFNKVMDAFGLQKGNEEEKAARSFAIENANKGAAMIPAQVMETAFSSFELLNEMAKEGNPNSITDVGVGVLCIYTAVMGAAYNVRINLGGIKDSVFISEYKEQVERITAAAQILSADILKIVESKIK